MLFVVSALAQYTGAVIAIELFDDVRPATVAWLRVSAAAAILVTFGWSGLRRPWTRHEARSAVALGVITALMNLCFYLAIERLPLGSSVSIEFIGPIAVAAALTRTTRNGIALAFAAAGVVVLGGANIDAEPLGLLFILAASALWAAYIVIGSTVARHNRGMSGLALGLTVGAIVLIPFGATGSGAVFSSGSLLVRAAAVGAFSNAIGYGIDQIVLRRMSTRRFAVMLALLPVTALVVGVVALGERPAPVDLLGTALVVLGIVVQERRN
jgi:inner membrane transporter RhtA